jgi:hypothetical protein
MWRFLERLAGGVSPWTPREGQGLVFQGVAGDQGQPLGMFHDK